MREERLNVRNSEKHRHDNIHSTKEAWLLKFIYITIYDLAFEIKKDQTRSQKMKSITRWHYQAHTKVNQKIEQEATILTGKE